MTGAGIGNERASRALFALGIVGSAMALGALHTPVLLVVLALFSASACFAWRQETSWRLRPPAKVLFGLAGVLLAFTALQALPLPMGVVDIVAPANADVWHRALSPLHLPAPAWAALSLDPIATRVEVLRGITYLTAFLAAIRIARGREGGVFLERLLVGSAVAIAFGALVHPAVGADRVFGLYKPTNDIAARHIAPLLNANHLAGYVNIGACLAVGAALSPRPHVPRTLAAGAAVLLVGTTAWTASRGGVGSIVVGLALIGIMARASRQNDREGLPAAVLVLIGVTVASGGALLLASNEAAWSELAVTDVSKLDIVRQSVRVLASSPIVGIGRGAFATVFPAFRVGTGDYTFTHPEDLLAQWSVEWGAPLAIVALGACFWALRPSVMLARSRPPIGAWAALACLFIHNLVDFSTEVPGVMVALVTCAALVVGGSAGASRARQARKAILVPSRAVAVIGALAVVGLFVGMSTLGSDDESDGIHLRAYVMSADRVRDRATFEKDAAAAMLRHPADPYLPYIGALRAATAHDSPELPWIERTLERANVYGRAHLLLARSLFRVSPAQARLEYRTAYLQDANTMAASTTEGSRLVQSYDDARELAPGTSPLEIHALSALASNVGPRLPATAQQIDAELATRAHDGPALARLASAALEDLGDPAASWCDDDRSACLAHADDLVKRARSAAPAECRTDALAANLARARGQEDEALDLLSNAIRSDPSPLGCVAPLVAIAASEPDAARSEKLFDRVATLGCTGLGDACVATLLALGDAEETRGKPRRALAFVKQAYDRDGRDDILLRVARLAAATGLHAEAIEDYRKLSLRHPDDAQWAAKVDAEREVARAFHAPPLPKASASVVVDSNL